MNDAVRSGIIERDPGGRADRIKGIEPRQRFVTEDEWQHILRGGRYDRTRAGGGGRTPSPNRSGAGYATMSPGAYESGMRRAEIHNLTWDRVRKVDDETTVTSGDASTKTGRPRFVTWRKWISILAALRKLERAKGGDRLFPVSMTTLKRSLTALWKATGLQDVRLHDLRRTHATILIQHNVDPRGRGRARPLGDRPAGKTLRR